MIEILKAVNDKVVIEVMKGIEQKTESGIIIADNVPQTSGKVVSVGDEVSSDIDIGCIVLCAKHGGQDIVLNNKIYKVLLDKEIYGVYTKVDE